ncbi:hypothetical protein GCM10011491_30390 [Brucella endophytica]|uniref:HTH cro/C1-type domain-containing protein n=1 Tax=Brucella endophytica TaxID=1963359 RepID=A0A916SHB3_9HYPH|nr:helix-turn-helix transcriptional regulator [Brucella endophytica]GGB00065.1 hypothetical protein GCM10011491_30390 [Brucella endophytica]
MTNSPQIEIDEDAIDQAVGVNLRRIRNVRGISQEKLGESVGITFQQIQKYEKGTNRIAASRMVQFAAVLKCGIPDFFAGIGSDGQIRTISAISPEALRYGEMIDKIQDAGILKHLASLIGSLAELPAPNAGLSQFWRPIAEADTTITFEHTMAYDADKEMTIRNSDHYWVRDEDGRVYESVWTDHKGGYWWDIEGESPVDPVEYMPHPLEIISSSGLPADEARP